MSKESNRHSFVRVLLAALFCAGLLLPLPAQAADHAPGRLLLPFAGDKACAGRNDPNMPLGVQMYGNTSRKSPYMPYLLQSGASWVRVLVQWRTIEATQGTYNFSSVESAIAAYRDACVNIILLIDYTADWAATQTGASGYPNRSPIKTANLDDYANFVAALAERYDGDKMNDSPSGLVVNYIELYNEPDYYKDGVDGGGWGNAGARYAEMLATVQPKLKAANPNAKLVFGGIAHDFFAGEEATGVFVRSFLDNVLTAGGGDHFDIMNLHYYPKNRANWTDDPDSTGFAEKIQAVRAILAAHGYGDKPIIVTEVGWHSNASEIFPSTEEIQSRYVVQLLAQALANDVQIVIWWMLYSPGSDHPFDDGLVTENLPGSPTTTKPAFAVYQQAVRRLGYAQFTAALTTAEVGAADLEVYQFFNTSTSQTTYVAWHNPSESDAPATLTLSIAAATVYSKNGTLIGVVNDGDDGLTDSKIKVQVGGSPVYIVVK